MSASASAVNQKASLLRESGVIAPGLVTSTVTNINGDVEDVEDVEEDVEHPTESTPLKIGVQTVSPSSSASFSSKKIRNYTALSPSSSPRNASSKLGIQQQYPSSITDQSPTTSMWRSDHLVQMNAKSKTQIQTHTKTMMERVWDILHILRKITIMIMLFMVALMMNVFQVINIILFYYTYRKWYRIGCELTDYWYGGLLITILETCSGMDIHIYGDANYFTPRLPCGSILDKAIVISNHTSYADWIIFFSIAYRRRSNQLLRIFLKYIAAYIPGIGWGTYLSDYFLIKKNIQRRGGNGGDTIQQQQQQQRDAQYQSITQRLVDYTHTKSRLWVALFPEGTFHDGAVHDLVDRHRVFAQEHNLPPLQYLLNPYPRGITSCIQHLRGHATHIIDMTMTLTGNNDTTTTYIQQYVGALPLDDITRVLPDASDCTSFRGPKAAHVHIQLHDMRNIPQDTEEIRVWLSNVWAEKDKLMEYFRYHGCFPGQHTVSKSYLFWGNDQGDDEDDDKTTNMSTATKNTTIKTTKTKTLMKNENWMIRFPIFWSIIAYGFYSFFHYLPTHYIQYGGLFCFLAVVMGILIQTFCKQR